jgi:hypothetical protein
MAGSLITSVSLRDVRKLIDDKGIGDSVADAVDTVLGLVITLSPVAMGAVAGFPAALAAIPLWQLIDPKNELIAVFKAAVGKLSRSAPADYLDRAEHMAAANCLLVYVAFFDAFRELWPSFSDALRLDEKDAKAVLMSASADESFTSGSGFVAEYGIEVPHPADVSLATAFLMRDRARVYASLSASLLKSVQAMVPAGAARPITLTDRLSRLLIARAEELYWAEYLGIAVEFRQFFMWSALRSQATQAESLQGLADGQAEAGAGIAELAEDQRTWFELLARDIYSLDLGLGELRAFIAGLPAPSGAVLNADVREAAERLHATYAAALGRRVIDEQFSEPDGAPGLTFPTKIKGFIPQAYRAVTCDRDDMHLERDEQWREAEVRSDIGAFVMRCLESPYSVQAPLLVLGHPGSGKSLLTEVLAGHLAYPSYTAIRVRLRDIDPDKTFVTLLEEQVQADSGGVHVSWASFAATLRMAPPVIILDGYDELLQATGKVFAAYLDSVREFQEQQALHKCPVRVIVTSRATLIDRARIPHGTTVIRLEEFDAERRQAWVDVWNEHNAPHFRLTQARPFTLPEREKLIQLARQPLLLLMLAIYDSAANELSSQPDIDQALLYDRLLRRFIERELSKGKKGLEFTASPRGPRAEAIDREIERLGIAAIGMFNRQDVKISRNDLNKDLDYLNAGQETGDGRALPQADLLLGSFFFVHESRSNLRDEPAASAAFEFLHNTFGEFLVADYLLRRAIEEAQTIRELSGSRRMDAKRAEHLSQLTEDWYACLIHTPLFTRPLILETIKEWSRHQLDDEQSGAGTLAALDEIVTAQLRIVLDDVSIPDPDPARRRESPYRQLPRRGHAAIYSLNLVLLRACLGAGPFMLDEAVLEEDPAGCRPWDSLTSLWRSWFSLESLAGLAFSVGATRRGNRVEIDLPGARPLPVVTSKLEATTTVAVALADDLVAASAGLHLALVADMPRDAFRSLWDRVGPGAGDLHAAAELLWLMKFGPDDAGDLAGSQDLALLEARSSLCITGFADVVSRLGNSPVRWRQAAAGLYGSDKFSRLSRYEAEAVVDAGTRLDSGWLPLLLRAGLDAHDGGLFFSADWDWAAILQRPAAAPLLRAAVREFDCLQCAESVEWIERDLDGHAPLPYDVDTAAGLAVFACKGGDRPLCAEALDVIIGRCEQGRWKLLDIPARTWEGLAAAFQSPSPDIARRKPQFTGILEATIAESLDAAGDDSFEAVHRMAPLWVQALRIGATRQAHRIIGKISAALAAENLPLVAGTERGAILSLIGWLRERDDPAFARSVFSGKYCYATWLDQFLRPPGAWDPASVDESVLGHDLRFKEAMDLRWVLGVLRDSGQQPPSQAPPDQARRRRRGVQQGRRRHVDPQEGGWR